MSFLNVLHTRCVYGGRINTLRDHLVQLIPRDAQVLDVGCGDGQLSHLVMEKRPDVKIRGLDVLVREETRIPVEKFDGQALPCDTGSYDVVMFMDVLHHTEDPMILLREAVRVGRESILIKDHTRDGLFAESTLRLMDWIGNAHHGVALPYNYWSRQQWLRAFDSLGVPIGLWKKDLGQYPAPASWVFGRSLHFIARLDLTGNVSAGSAAMERHTKSTYLP